LRPVLELTQPIPRVLQAWTAAMGRLIESADANAFETKQPTVPSFPSLFSDYPEGGRSLLLLNNRIYFQITSLNISEDWNLHENRCKNANSRKMKFFVRVTKQHNSSCVNVKMA